MKKIKTQVVFPEDMLKVLDKIVPRKKRSEFIVQAIQKEVERIYFGEILKEVAGAWSDENHPDLNKQQDVNRYLRRIRLSTNERIARLLESE